MRDVFGFGSELLRGVVHGHLQFDSDAELVVWEVLDADDLGDVFAVHGIVAGGIRESHKDAHAFVVALTPGMKVNTVF